MLNNVIDDKVDAYRIGVGYINETLPNVVEAYHNFTAECFVDGAKD